MVSRDQLQEFIICTADSPLSSILISFVLIKSALDIVFVQDNARKHKEKKNVGTENCIYCIQSRSRRCSRFAFVEARWMLFCSSISSNLPSISL